MQKRGAGVAAPGGDESRYFDVILRMENAMSEFDHRRQANLASEARRLVEQLERPRGAAPSSEHERADDWTRSDPGYQLWSPAHQG